MFPCRPVGWLSELWWRRIVAVVLPGGVFWSGCKSHSTLEHRRVGKPKLWLLWSTRVPITLWFAPVPALNMTYSRDAEKNQPLFQHAAVRTRWQTGKNDWQRRTQIRSFFRHNIWLWPMELWLWLQSVFMVYEVTSLLWQVHLQWRLKNYVAQSNSR